MSQILLNLREQITVTLAQCSQTKPYLPHLQWQTAKVKVTDLYLLTVPTSQYAEVHQIFTCVNCVFVTFDFW